MSDAPTLASQAGRTLSTKNGGKDSSKEVRRYDNQADDLIMTITVVPMPNTFPEKDDSKQLYV
jgi:hypothetical protein